MDSPPPVSDLRFHVDPLIHPSDASVVPGQIEIENAAGQSTATSAVASPLLAVRKVPPVPKFSPSDGSSLRPPSGNPRVLSRGIMGPPPVPKFASSSGEKVMGPPRPRAPQSMASSSLESSNGLAVSAPSASGEEMRGATELSGVSSIDNVVGNGGRSPTEMNVDSGDTLAIAAAAGEGGSAPVAEDESRGRELLSEAVSSGASSSSNQPYSVPPWSAMPGYPYCLEILKDGSSLGIVDVSQKGAYMFGRSDRCDFVLEHPTVSRYHAVLQYSSKGESLLYDLGSTHGTFINKIQVKGKEYAPLHVGDILRFGYSSRLHVFQGPVNLMPKEGLSRKERLAQRLLDAAHDSEIREASLLRGRRDALASDGISWGMQEDAEEEEEENAEEITWQTFKGELTERQQKTLEKIHKHNEKLTNLRKEIDAINAKETSQGGLTQGQQTQIARNDQRMGQLVDELENLEETLNESIQESIHGRTGKGRRGKKDPVEDEDEDLSDDEFYDRASKLHPQKKKETLQIAETADSLLDKRAILSREIENVRQAIEAEEQQNLNSTQQAEVEKVVVESEDPLDQFMTNLSSKILKERTSHLQKELDTLVKDKERIVRLLKIADPTGEAFKKWENKSVDVSDVPEILPSKMEARISPKQMVVQELATKASDAKDTSKQAVLQDSTVVAGREGNVDADSVVQSTSKEDATVLPGLEPPIRLGAPMPEVPEEIKVEFSAKVNEEAVNFVTYKDRKKSKGDRDTVTVADVGSKGEVPKIAEKRNVSAVDVHVADSVALLLRHKRGLVTADTDGFQNVELDNHIARVEDKKNSKQSLKKRRKGGPVEISQTTDTDDMEEWVPPAGQSGDGRTALNDKYGY